MSKYGCPYKTRNPGTCEPEYCPVIRKNVIGFVMCECDWESCTDFWKQKKRDDYELKEYNSQDEANRADEELEILVRADELLGEDSGQMPVTNNKGIGRRKPLDIINF